MLVSQQETINGIAAPVYSKSTFLMTLSIVHSIISPLTHHRLFPDQVRILNDIYHRSPSLLFGIIERVNLPLEILITLPTFLTSFANEME